MDCPVAVLRLLHYSGLFDSPKKAIVMVFSFHIVKSSNFLLKVKTYVLIRMHFLCFQEKNQFQRMEYMVLEHTRTGAWLHFLLVMALLVFKLVQHQCLAFLSIWWPCFKFHFLPSHRFVRTNMQSHRFGRVYNLLKGRRHWFLMHFYFLWTVNRLRVLHLQELLQNNFVYLITLNTLILAHTHIAATIYQLMITYLSDIFFLTSV